MVILRDMQKNDIKNYVHWFTVETEWSEKWDAPWEGKIDATIDEETLKWTRYFQYVDQLSKERLRTKFEIEVYGNHIGWASAYRDLGYLENPEKIWAIGIDIPVKDARNKGYGTQALKLFIDYLFDQGEGKLYIQTWSGNKPMIKIILNLGFKEYCRKTNYRIIDKKPYDAITYILEKISYDKHDC